MKLRRIFASIVITILTITALAIKSYAAVGSFSIGVGSSSLDIGGTTTLSVTATNCEGKFTISSSDSSVVSVGTSSIWAPDTSSVTLTAKKTGTATITVTASDVADTDVNDVTGSKTVKVTVKEKETKPKEDNNTGNTSTDPKQNPGSEPQSKPETKEEKKSGEYHLKELSTSVGTLKPSFNTYNQDYTLEFPEDYDMSELKSIEVSAKATDSKAKVSGTGAFEVKEGENEIIVNCTAENGKVLAYRIKFTKVVKAQQSDLRLKTFSITRVREEDKKQVLAQLNEEFKSDVFDYTMDIDENTNELNIDYEIEEKFKDKITVEITGNKDLKPGENIITIKLTSKDDDKITTTYTIKVKKAGEVAEEKPVAKTEGGFNIKLIIIIAGSIIGLLVLILIILLIVNHFQKKKAKEAMKADDDNNFVGGDNGFDADIGHDIRPVGVVTPREESNESNYDYLSREDEIADEQDEDDDEKRFGRAGYNTIHQSYDAEDEEDEEYAGIDDTDLPEGTVSEHMINARLNGEADELKRRYEIDELQEEIADELKEKKTKRKGRGRRFK